MDLKNLITNDKVISIEHPELEGFKVDIAFMSAAKTKKLINRATTSVFSRKTHLPEDKVDQDLFLQLWTKEVIKGWTGLKCTYLTDLLPVDLSTISEEEGELEYSESNALTMMKNSQDFDNWLTSVIGDVRNFNKSN